ncbi:hypothetical protein, partial [Klebsiella pneumoniae]|uniref:hypothetical protein n=1 Tax=Klebsiella pneumoniae TaxID=573 RepID=UPI001C808F4B
DLPSALPIQQNQNPRYGIPLSEHALPALNSQTIYLISVHPCSDVSGSPSNGISALCDFFNGRS